MYRFSRAIYREFASQIVEDDPARPNLNHERVLRACEAAVERLATDRHYFARPARSLFLDIRGYFPVAAQRRVLMVVQRYMAFADDFVRNQPNTGFDLYGNPLRCRASTRKGTPCQRLPLAHNGYCPSHQHLAETDDPEIRADRANRKRQNQLDELRAA
ncbi:MAG: hypothetical protein ACP5H2_01835 [Solirubrobacteraceae bacterium]